MILAAGLGSRLKPFTDQHPKALAQVNGKSLLQRNVEYLHSYGITDILVNVHHFATQITAAIEENQGWGCTIRISDETGELLETGGGIKKAAWFFETDEEPFLLLNVDILTDIDLKEMEQYHRKRGALATLAVSERETSRYFLFDPESTLCGWENIKTGEKVITRPEATSLKRKAFSGLHMISPAIFKLMRQSGKFSMVEVYLDLSPSNAIAGYEPQGKQVIDVGKPESIRLAEKMFR